MTDLRLAVFASGSGSNMQAIVDAIDSGYIPAEIALVVSNRSDAGVVERARKHDIPFVILDPKSYEDEDRYTAEVLRHLDAHGVNFITLAGYLRKVPSEVVRRYRERMLNIHPALLPAFGGKGFYGRRVHEAVLEYGVRWTGVTVHLVDEEYDTGPIVMQEPVPVSPGDSAESLAARVLETEHRIYPAAVKAFAEGRVQVEGRRVIVSETPD
jgi:phosphoribosylglycinamide formyltransferase-1